MSTEAEAEAKVLAEAVCCSYCQQVEPTSPPTKTHTGNGTFKRAGTDPVTDHIRNKPRGTKRQFLAHALLFEREAVEMLAELKETRKATKQDGSENGSCDNKSRSEPDSGARDFLALTRAWDTALERIRILKGQPNPGSRRPSPDPTKERKPSKPKNAAPDLSA